MLGERNRKKYDDYGPHKYHEFKRGHGRCGCGCWWGPVRSGGPTGIDPSGHCPENPLDGQRQAGEHDYEDCVSGRIEKLEKEIEKAQQFINIVERAKKGTKIDLVRRLDAAEKKIVGLISILCDTHAPFNRLHSVLSEKEIRSILYGSD